MPTPGEHKTVQARILEYAETIGWTFVSREKAEHRRGIAAIRNGELGITNFKAGSLFFDDLLDAKVRNFNPRYAEAAGALLGQFRHLHTDIYGNREFVEHLRNRGKFFDSCIDLRHPQSKHTHEAFWKTSDEQHIDRS